MTDVTITTIDGQSPIQGRTLKIVKISGQLDESNVDQKIQDVYKLLEETPQNLDLIFDLEELEYMNSKSIGYLTDLYGKTTESGGKIALAKAKPNIQDILQVVGLTQLVQIYDSIETAKQEINGGNVTAPDAGNSNESVAQIPEAQIVQPQQTTPEVASPPIQETQIPQAPEMQQTTPTPTTQSIPEPEPQTIPPVQAPSAETQQVIPQQSVTPEVQATPQQTSTAISDSPLGTPPAKTNQQTTGATQVMSQQAENLAQSTQTPVNQPIPQTIMTPAQTPMPESNIATAPQAMPQQPIVQSPSTPQQTQTNQGTDNPEATFNLSA